MKKLITVTWSVSIEKDVPEDFTMESKDYSALVVQTMHDAWQQVQKSYGEITDIQDNEFSPAELAETAAEERRRDEKHGLYGGLVDNGN